MTNAENGRFRQNFALKLILEADGEKNELLAGVIDDVSLELHTYGFKGIIRFRGYDNAKLNTLFHTQKSLKFTLIFHEQLKGLPIFELKGIVTERRWKRVDEANNNKNIPVCLYQITISDNAQVTWGEHYPINIYVNKSMKEVFEEHKNPEISLKYDFPPLEKTHSITAFSLCYDNHLSAQGQVSFYSFLTWYLHQEGGIFSYDYKGNAYSILAKKKDGEPFKISEWLVAPVNGLVPPEPRFNTKSIKHSPDAIDAENKENENSFKSVRRDFIDPSKYRTFPEHAFQPVASPLTNTHPEMELFPHHFENDFQIDKLIPGSLISFTSDKRSWTDDPLIKDQVFRSRVLFFYAENRGSSDPYKSIQNYQITLKTILESKEEVFIERPPFSTPHFPFEIEGKIFSDIGEKEQSTYKISEEEKAPQGQYLVTIPLAGKEPKIVVPFTPNLSSGQQYYPFLKDEKVLLAMYFEAAYIKRVVDWNKLVRLPTGVQGVQTVFSSNGKDKYSILKHEFEDGKDSVVTLQQATSAEQAQTITIKDKEIIINVVEKDKKTVIMRYHSDEGITITFIDVDAKTSQQISMNGKQISQTCKDSSDTSTFVQTPSSFTFTGKEFNLLADNLIFDISDIINHKAGSKLNMEAPVINGKGFMKVEK